MNDSLKHKIFIETDCISEQTMFDYIDKKLSARESHSVEKHLLHCELCSDALEGLELTNNRERIAVINQKVREYIALKKETRLISFNYKLIISIAASVLLLIGGIFFFNQFSKKDEIAEFKSENAVQPPPPPSPSSFMDDESTSDSINVSPINIAKEAKQIETKKEENTVETDVKFRLDKIIKTDQPATSEGQGSIADSRTSNPIGKGASEGVSATYIPQRQAEEYKKGISEIPAKSESNATEDRVYQGAKDGNFAELKNAEAAGGAPGEELIELSEPVAAKAKSAQPMGARDNVDSGSERAKKKSDKTTGLFRLESKEKRSVEKEIDEVNISNNIAYAPQSIITTDENAETTKSEESQGNQMQDVFTSVEQMPEFPGGQDSLIKFIHENFKYPSGYKTESSGTKKLYVTFIVDEEGRIKNTKILKGINSELDKEALRVVNSMPKWKPGINNGKNVSVSFNLPIKLE